MRNHAALCTPALAQSSFKQPILDLPQPRRHAMQALYAFFRIIDDAVDQDPDRNHAVNTVQFWRNEVMMMYAGKTPAHPVTRLLQPYLADYHLPREHFEAMLDGQEMEARGQMVLPDKDRLEHYCYCVAATVGLLSIRIFGYQHPDTERYAIALGKGLQYINMYRDVEEDMQHGRIYVPLSVIEGTSLKQKELSEYTLQRIRHFLKQNAENHLQKAEMLLPDEDREQMQPARDMQAVYQRYLND